MIPLAQMTFGLLALLVIGQSILVWRFFKVLRRSDQRTENPESLPPATVVIALRGYDPFLNDCIQGILNQDYPTYHVIIVIDHETDPAHSVVRDLIEAQIKSKAATVEIRILSQPAQNRSLKCSSLLLALENLDPEKIEILALLDADTVPHSTWLQELAIALEPDSVGAVSGNRWYLPENLTYSSLIRHIWNAGAIVQMVNYSIPWGGSMAIKTKLLESTGLLDRWSKSFCEDTMMPSVLGEFNLKTAFVPSLIMVNREVCEFAGFNTWVRRQLLTARLYHAAFPLVLGHGIVSTLVPVLTAALLIGCLATFNWVAGIWALAALLVYECSVFVMLVSIDFAVRKNLAKRKESTSWIRPWQFGKYFIAMIATQLTYLPALVSASLLRNVNWRGIEYRVRGPWRIKMSKYEPYQELRSREDRRSL